MSVADARDYAAAKTLKGGVAVTVLLPQPETPIATITSGCAPARSWRAVLYDSMTTVRCFLREILLFRRLKCLLCCWIRAYARIWVFGAS